MLAQPITGWRERRYDLITTEPLIELGEPARSPVQRARIVRPHTNCATACCTAC
jgi:hypothetical protein